MRLSRPRSHVILTVIKTFTTNFGGIHNIECSKEGDVYYNYNSRNEHDSKLDKVKITFNGIETLKSFNVKCFDFHLNSTGDLFYSPVPGHSMEKVSTSGKQETVFTVFQKIILAIHVTMHDELMIGLRDDGDKYILTSDSCRQILSFDSDFECKSLFEYDSYGNRLFTYVARIVTNSTGEIYVIDWLDHDHTGKIVGLRANGNLKFIYDGYPDINTIFAPFNPEGLTVTPNGNAVISDVDNSTLHVLNTYGELIAIQNTKSCGIFYPYSLAFDASNQLLIGCITEGDEHAENGKLHVVDILSFV